MLSRNFHGDILPHADIGGLATADKEGARRHRRGDHHRAAPQGGRHHRARIASDIFPGGCLGEFDSREVCRIQHNETGRRFVGCLHLLERTPDDVEPLKTRTAERGVESRGLVRQAIQVLPGAAAGENLQVFLLQHGIGKPGFDELPQASQIVQNLLTRRNPYGQRANRSHSRRESHRSFVLYGPFGNGRSGGRCGRFANKVHSAIDRRNNAENVAHEVTPLGAAHDAGDAFDGHHAGRLRAHAGLSQRGFGLNRELLQPRRHRRQHDNSVLTLAAHEFLHVVAAAEHVAQFIALAAAGKTRALGNVAVELVAQLKVITLDGTDAGFNFRERLL